MYLCYIYIINKNQEHYKKTNKSLFMQFSLFYYRFRLKFIVRYLNKYKNIPNRVNEKIS